MFGFSNSNKKNIPKQSQEALAAAAKSTTFSLLEKLYQASILTSMPMDIGKEITTIVRRDLDVELAGIYIFEKDTDSLVPLAFAKSAALVEGLYRVESLIFEKEKYSQLAVPKSPGQPPEEMVKDLHRLEYLFETTPIKNISIHDFFKKIIYGKEDTLSNSLLEVYGDILYPQDLEKIGSVSGVKNLLGYPLIKGKEVFGILFLAISHDYENVGIFELSSIGSIINAIALLVDKAYLYKNLLTSYEIEKRGREKMQQAYEIEKQSKLELEKLDKDKTDFMLITQHHLRTPLTSMIGYIHLINTGDYGKLTKDLKELLDKFEISTRILIKTVETFLDISQFEMGKNGVSMTKDVNLETMVQEIVDELKPQIKIKKLFLRVEPPSQKIPLIEADAMKLATAITSIIDNSIQYTAKGGSTVKLDLQEDSVQIIIEDTGIGIEKEQLPNVLNNLFTRNPTAQKLNAIGRGMGLYLANKIVLGHQGKIWVDSEGLGKGSTFYIQLPIRQK